METISLVFYTFPLVSPMTELHLYLNKFVLKLCEHLIFIDLSLSTLLSLYYRKKFALVTSKAQYKINLPEQM
jgi:hypothetical protein